RRPPVRAGDRRWPRARAVHAPVARTSRGRLQVDRRRPGALFVVRETVVVEGRAVVAVAGMHLRAGSFGVAFAAQAAGVHGWRLLLDRAHVVDGRAPVQQEARILELDGAAGAIGGTIET